MDSMIIDNGPVAVSFPCHFYCSTNGKGAWTEKVFATLIHRVVLFESGEIWAFYKPCLDTEAAKEWENSGELIYTDPQWIALFNRFGTNLRIFYTEQGMQGRNYVSMESNNFDLCKEIFQSFANKEKEIETPRAEISEFDSPEQVLSEVNKLLSSHNLKIQNKYNGGLCGLDGTYNLWVVVNMSFCCFFCLRFMLCLFCP